MSAEGQDHSMETSTPRKPPPPPPVASARCPECGAANPPAAEWCGQCFARFAQTEPAGTVDPAITPGLLSDLASDDGRAAPPPPPVRRPSKRTDHDDGTFTITDEGISWTCKRCDSVNDFDRNICQVCGATFADAIKPHEEQRPARDPNTAALVSLFLPGAGHGYIGMWGQAIARAIISIWVTAVAIFSAAQEAAPARVMGILFGLVATALWGVAAHDAHREASGAPKLVLLKQKFFLYLVLGLLMLSVIMIFMAAVGART